MENKDKDKTLSVVLEVKVSEERDKALMKKYSMISHLSLIWLANKEEELLKELTLY